jgi:hypothetical protein
VLLAAAEEQFAVVGLDDLTCGFEVTLGDEVGVCVHAMYLNRDVRRPGRAELRRWKGRVEEQGAAGAWPRLGKLLCGQDSHRKPA